MTDDDTNEETARARHRTMLYQRSELGLNGVLTHSAETFIWLGAITTHCEDRFCIKVFCKPIKHLFTLRTTRWTWSAR